MQLSQVLTKLMSEHNLSAYKLSKETGISDRLIGYWKNGDKLPGAENLIILANYFNTSVDYLLGREQKITSTEINPQKRILIDNYDKMTENAQHSLVEYSDYMVSKPENLKSNTDTSQMIS